MTPNLKLLRVVRIIWCSCKVSLAGSRWWLAGFSHLMLLSWNDGWNVSVCTRLASLRFVRFEYGKEFCLGFLWRWHSIIKMSSFWINLNHHNLKFPALNMYFVLKGIASILENTGKVFRDFCSVYYRLFKPQYKRSHHVVKQISWLATT